MCPAAGRNAPAADRKSTRLNSSHPSLPDALPISMAERNRQHPLMRALIYVALLALLATGLLWKLDMDRALLMKIHGAAAMAGMVLLGALLARHVPCGWKKRASRRSEEHTSELQSPFPTRRSSDLHG